MSILILGLGPGAWGQMTIEAKDVLNKATEVYLRTERHPTVAHLPAHLKLHSFDYLYEQCSTFEAVYEGIVKQVLALGHRPQGVIYAVPGHPLVGEATVRGILSRHESEGLDVRLVSGMSFVEPILSALRIDPFSQGLQIADAIDARIDPSVPALIGQVYSRGIATVLKDTLLQLYPPEHEVTVIAAAGIEGEEKVYPLRLCALDQAPIFDHLTSVYLPPLTLEQNLATFASLQLIVARLRAPDGCPWDRKQTHTSLKPYLIEEAYETLAALDEGDTAKLCEELGDLLLQIALHAQMATEAGEFEMADVLRAINAKLIRRHPHIFGTAKVANAEEVESNWEALKREEREEGTSMLASVPRQMPALAYSQAIQRRAAQVGFDWKEFQGIEEKLAEEVRELKQATGHTDRLRELGDVLFALANAARWLGVDLEEALRLANERFYRRFQYMEEACRRRGLSLEQLPFEEQNTLWEEAKRRLKA